VVPLNARLTLPELGTIVADAEPRLLLTDREFADTAGRLCQTCPAIEDVLFADDGPVPEGLTPYEAALAAPVADAKRGGDDVAAIFYTGGTTGLPRA